MQQPVAEKHQVRLDFVVWRPVLQKPRPERAEVISELSDAWKIRQEKLARGQRKFDDATGCYQGVKNDVIRAFHVVALTIFSKTFGGRLRAAKFGELLRHIFA